MEDKSLTIETNNHINSDETNKNERQYSSKLFSFLESNNKKTKDYYILQQNLKGLNQDLKLFESNQKGKIKLYRKINRRSSVIKPNIASPNNQNFIRKDTNISLEKPKIKKVKQLKERNSSKKKNKLNSPQVKKSKNLILTENSKQIQLPKLISYTTTNNNSKLDNIKEEKEENLIISNADYKSTNENSKKNELPLIKSNRYYKKINNSNVSSGKYRQMNRNSYDNDDEEQSEKMFNIKNFDFMPQNNNIILIKKNLLSPQNSSENTNSNNSRIFQPTEISDYNELLYSAGNRGINRNRSVRKLFQKNNMIDNTEQFILKMRKKSNKIENRIKRGMFSQNLIDWEMKSRIKLNQWKYGVAEIQKYFIDMQAYGKPEEDELVNRKTFFNHVEDIIKDVQESLKQKQIKIITEQYTEQKKPKDKDKDKENMKNKIGYNEVENVINKQKEFSQELSQIKVRQKNERKTRDYIDNILFRSEVIAKRIKNSDNNKIKTNNNMISNKKNGEENKKDNKTEVKDQNKNKKDTEKKEENNNVKEDDHQLDSKNDENKNNE